jgi:hypothetical protein
MSTQSNLVNPTNTRGKKSRLPGISRHAGSKIFH